MFNRILILSFSLLLGVMIFSSCEKESLATPETTENYVTDALNDLQDSARCGKFHCFDFVFPITIVLPDSTTSEVNSYVELKEAIRSWKEANPDADTRPTLGFPLDIMTPDGEIITVEDAAELRQLARRCRRFVHRRHHQRHTPCFNLVYPISVEFPNGEIISFDRPQGLHAALHRWKRNNPDSDVRPMIQYPLTVEFEDGTTQTVNNADELQAIKEACMDAE